MHVNATASVYQPRNIMQAGILATVPQSHTLPQQAQSQLEFQGVSSGEYEFSDKAHDESNPALRRVALVKLPKAQTRLQTHHSCAASHMPPMDYGYLCALISAFTGPTAACMEERKVVLPRATPSADRSGHNNNTTCMQTSAARLKNGDSTRYWQRHLQQPRQRAQDRRIDLVWSGAHQGVSPVQQQRQQRQCHGNQQFAQGIQPVSGINRNNSRLCNHMHNKSSLV